MHFWEKNKSLNLGGKLSQRGQITLQTRTILTQNNFINHNQLKTHYLVNLGTNTYKYLCITFYHVSKLYNFNFNNIIKQKLKNYNYFLISKSAFYSVFFFLT